jgi:hypothetical protein
MTGRYRLVARAVSGSGEQSRSRTVRFRVVGRVPHRY